MAAFGPYAVVRKIGDGGMGAVYEGRHKTLGKRVALKVLLPEMAGSPELAARFVREGQAAARIRHPHVVDVYDVGTSTSGAYLVMELLEGEDLGTMLEKRGKLSVEESLGMLLPVFSAVSAAHGEGVIHRDLKPANVFISRDPVGRLHPKVVDFGISKIVEDRGGMVLTQSAAVLGTPYYMAPEQVQSVKNTDARSDQYSLAVIVFECITGQRPFVADSLYELLLAVTGLDAPAASTVSSSVPPGLSDAIKRAMSRDPAQRFPSVRALGQALLPYADGLTRSMWAPDFGESLNTPRVSASEPDAGVRPAPPPPAAPAASGFGAPNLATGLEFSSARTPQPRRSSRVLAAAAAVLAVGAGLAVAAFLLSTRSASVQWAAPESDSAVVAPAKASASEVPLAVDSGVAEDANAAPPSDSTAAPAASSASPPLGTVAPTGTSRKQPPAAKTESPPGPAATPTQPGDGAIRGANSAWIVR